ncbi:prenyltransferase [Halobellus captivus]|uniref:prenyltransferase n=1 Tax=Halobellus captivus TaxID=2592614 RepID=UPI00119DECAC|nr:prenyltransferase [Halobellus captivus]
MATHARTGGITGRLRYLLTLSRPRFWLYLAGPVAVGATFGAETTADLFAPVTLVLFAYFLLPANVFLYGVNDVFDADVDADNPKKTEREARWRGDPSIAVLIAASAVLGVAVFGVAPLVAWPYLVGFFFLGLQYSAPPLRFKTTPVLDSVSNGLYILPGAAAYAAVAGAHPPLAALAGAWLWTMGMHTFSAIPDIEPDTEVGIRTTATFLGERRTLAYCLGCWLAAAVTFALVDVRIGLLLVAYPALVFVIYRSNVDVERAYWWYPIVNTAVGTVLTLGGLWRLVYA